MTKGVAGPLIMVDRNSFAVSKAPAQEISVIANRTELRSRQKRLPSAAQKRAVWRRSS